MMKFISQVLKIIISLLLVVAISPIPAYSSPSVATLISPVGNVSSNPHTYKWLAVSGASWYYLYVSDRTGNKIKKWYKSSEVSCSSGEEYCTINPNTNLTEGEARWWIRAWDSSGSGAWSRAKIFNVGAISIGYEIVSKTCNGGGVHCTASCPAGKKVIGGGCKQHDFSPLFKSYPATDTSWTCDDIPDGKITTYAICTNIK